MKIGIIGLPGAGKSTVFSALTMVGAAPGTRGENRIGTVRVPDTRVDILSKMYQPRKTIYAQVEYMLPGRPPGGEKSPEPQVWTPVRDCDALIHVIRNFRGYGAEPPNPLKDFLAMEEEMIFSDLVVVEKRLERLAQDKRRGKKTHPEEGGLLADCLKILENEKPLRETPELASAPVLKGFAFLSAKPLLALFNNEDEDDQLPDMGRISSRIGCMAIRGKLEQELSQMSEAEARDFLSAFDITASAMDRVIKKSYELQGLISFFTVGEDEVRAWTIKKETPALDAAEVIHSDIKKGFIRAEVVAYDDLMDAGSHPEARKRGTVRLEGKTYPVADGDIINFRFNV